MDLESACVGGALDPTYYTSRLQIQAGRLTASGSLEVSVQEIFTFDETTSEYSLSALAAIEEPSLEDDATTGQKVCKGALKEIEYTVLINAEEDDHLAISGVNARVVLDDITAEATGTVHVQQSFSL